MTHLSSAHPSAHRPHGSRAPAAALLCGAVFAASCNRQPPPPPPAIPEVAVVAVGTEAVRLTTELPGRTVPYLIAEIRPQVSGLVQKRLFTEGADVKAGQTLYEIDPAPFKAAFDSATANLEAARRAVDRAQAALGAGQAGVARQRATLEFANANRARFEELFKEKAVSANDRDQAVTAAKEAEASLAASEAQVRSDQSAVAAAEAAVLQAGAALETARINLGYTKITAPIPGRIGKSAVTDGAIVTAYQQLPLAAIQQLDPVYVDVPQSTADQLRLRRRLEDGRLNRSGADVSKVSLILEDGSNYPLEGTLQFSDVSVDATTGSVILRMVFPNPDGVLLPGMFVRAVIQEGVNEKAILVPQQTVSRDTKGLPVTFVVGADGKVEQRALVLDREIGDRCLVSDGLKPGEKIIVEGALRVRHGSDVRTVPFEAGKAPAATAAGK